MKSWPEYASNLDQFVGRDLEFVEPGLPHRSTHRRCRGRIKSIEYKNLRVHIVLEDAADMDITTEQWFAVKDEVRISFVGLHKGITVNGDKSLDLRTVEFDSLKIYSTGLHLDQKDIIYSDRAALSQTEEHQIAEV